MAVCPELTEDQSQLRETHEPDQRMLAAAPAVLCKPVLTTHVLTTSHVRIILHNRSSAEIQASRELQRVRSTYDQVDLDAWVPYLDQAVTTASAIDAMRTPETNPFTLTLDTLTGISTIIDDIRGNMLDSLSVTVKEFNSLWHNNASVAFEVG